MDRAQPSLSLGCARPLSSLSLSLIFSHSSIVTLSLQQVTRYDFYLSSLNFLHESIVLTWDIFIYVCFWWILGLFCVEIRIPLLRIIMFLVNIVYFVGFETCMVGFSFDVNGIWNYWHGWLSYSLIYTVLDIVIIRIMILLLECPIWIIMSLLPL